MEKKFEELNEQDKEQLTNAPVWVALLAAYSQDGEISEKEEVKAIRHAHVKTFSGNKKLQSFYSIVDEKFEERFQFFQNGLPENEEERENYIKNNIKSCITPLPKLESGYASALTKSLEEFYDKVFTADSTVVSRFLLPIITSKLNMEELDGFKTSTN